MSAHTDAAFRMAQRDLETMAMSGELLTLLATGVFMDMSSFRVAVFIADPHPLLNVAAVISTIDAEITANPASAAEAARLEASDADLIVAVLDANDATLFNQVLQLRPALVQLPLLILYRKFQFGHLMIACGHGINGHALQSLDSTDFYHGLLAVQLRALYFCPIIAKGFWKASRDPAMN
jgi:hypothetical protein